MSTHSFRLKMALDRMKASLVHLGDAGQVVRTVPFPASIPYPLDFLSAALNVPLRSADMLMLGVEMRHEDEVDVAISPADFARLVEDWAACPRRSAQEASRHA